MCYNPDMDNTLNLLDTVVATVNLSDHSVLAGDIGAVVQIYTSPNLAYEVEFVNPDGVTRALLTLTADQVRRLAPADVLTTRQLPLDASKDGSGGPSDKSDAAFQLLVAAGLLTPPAAQSDIAPVSDADRRAIADLLGHSPGNPLSDLVIKDRGD